MAEGVVNDLIAMVENIRDNAGVAILGVVAVILVGAAGVWYLTYLSARR